MKLRREGVVNERVADRNEVEAPNPVSRSSFLKQGIRRELML